MSVPTITPALLKERLGAPGAPRLLDVRSPAEFREVHVQGAHNLPLDQVTRKAVAELAGTGAQEVFLICKSGGRSQQACQRLVQEGFPGGVSVEGGTTACVAAGLPVEHGKKTISLERQVRIAAGSLVLLGCLLSYGVHPYCLGLSAFVGAGLLFAGLTDTCGMGLLLARMPWNR